MDIEAYKSEPKTSVQSSEQGTFWTDLERAIQAEFLASEIAELTTPEAKAVAVPF